MLFVNSAPAANALPEDVFTNSLVYPNGSAVEPGTVVDAGTKLCMRTQYQKQTGEDDLTGKTINVAFSDTVVVDSPPAGNDAVQSVQNAGNGFDIKFKDPWPTGINQGFLDLCFTVEDVDVSGEVDVEWQLETREGSFQIIVKKDGDEPAN